MRHCHVAHTHVIHHTEIAQWTVDWMTTFHSNEAANFPFAKSVFDPWNYKNYKSRLSPAFILMFSKFIVDIPHLLLMWQTQKCLDWLPPIDEWHQSVPMSWRGRPCTESYSLHMPPKTIDIKNSVKLLGVNMKPIVFFFKYYRYYLSSNFTLAKSDDVCVRWGRTRPWFQLGQVSNIQGCDLIFGVVTQSPRKIIVAASNKNKMNTPLENLFLAECFQLDTHQ